MWQIKRVYEKSEPADGLHVLVDRLWPRGVSKERANLDLWLKEIAPSAELRIWFGHKPERFEEFSQNYITELESNPAVTQLRELAKGHKTVTLLYAAKDPLINHAIVLQKFLQDSQ